jgi:hypothetical protein
MSRKGSGLNKKTALGDQQTVPPQEHLETYISAIGYLPTTSMKRLKLSMTKYMVVSKHKTKSLVQPVQPLAVQPAQPAPPLQEEEQVEDRPAQPHQTVAELEQVQPDQPDPRAPEIRHLLLM